jgi:large subunit ribosomal protein L24
MSVKLKIKKGDSVIVISGDAKGKTGKVVEIEKEKNRAIVEVAAPINISNLMFSESGKATRVGRREENGKVVRYSKKSNNTIK